MSDVIGNNIKLSLFGESHNEYIGATLINMVPGIEIDEEYIKRELSKRAPSMEGETNRHEDDDFEIISGVFHKKTTGAPLTILIKNKNYDSKDYETLETVLRPSHADYTAHMKYKGFNDFRGGGHLSGRLTAAIVAVCSILKKYLEEKGIVIASHIKQIGDIKDSPFDMLNVSSVSSLNDSLFPTFSNEAQVAMENKIKEVANNGDSIGGSIETIVAHIIPGLGNPYFDSLESQISHLLFSIPGIKGVNFGIGEEFVTSLGSKVNDEFYNAGGIIRTKTNNNGGINGGISNGMPITFTSIVKPTASIFKEQSSVTTDGNEVKLQIKGRHDSCLVRRIVPIINAITAFAIFDNYMEVLGKNFF